jgi:hypothetical protein
MTDPTKRTKDVAGVEVDLDSREWKACMGFLQVAKADLYRLVARPKIDERTADEARGGIKLIEALEGLSGDRPFVPSDIYTGSGT